MKIFFELPSGEVLDPQIIHTILTGITQHGKTEVIKSLIQFYQGEGYTVLVIDVKDKTIGKPDFAEYSQIPIYLEEVTDPLSLLGLLESNAKMKLRFQFPELIKASQRASTLRDVRDNLQAVIEGGRIHPVRKDKAEVLKLVLDKLIEEIESIESSDTLQIKQGEINCMNLSNQGFSSAFKQIVVRSVIRYVRMNLSKIFVIFDEAHIQVPEGYSSASKDWIVKTIKEGASSKQFLLIADQTIKEVDKNIVAQCHFKIFGGQAGGQLEAQRTYGYMPVKSGVNVESIMTLPLGHFYVCTRDWTKLCYALPRGVPEEIGAKVARGELTPEYVRDHFMIKIEKEEGDDIMYKEKFDALKIEYDKLKKKFDALEAEIEGVDIAEMKQELQGLCEQVEGAKETIEDLNKKNEKYENFLKAFAEIMPSAPVTATATELKEGQKITLEAEMTEINLEPKVPKEVSMTTKNPSGKLIYCAVQLHNRALKKDSKATPIFTSAELQKEAAEHGWQMTNMMIGKTLGSIIREGWMLKEADGYRLPTKLKINIKEKDA
jgi:predicted RNase H-like HicB family nuclease